MKTLNQLKTALLSMGLGELQVEKVVELAQELLDTRTQELLADVQRLTTERNGWQKQAEATSDLYEQEKQQVIELARKLDVKGPDLDAIEKANRRAEEAEARATEAGHQLTRQAYEVEDLKQQVTAWKEAAHVAEEQRVNAEEVKRLAVEDRDKVRDQRDASIDRVKQLGLFFRLQGLPLGHFEVLADLFRIGSQLSIDGEGYTIVAGELDTPSQGLWRLEVEIEVADE